MFGFIANWCYKAASYTYSVVEKVSSYGSYFLKEDVVDFFSTVKNRMQYVMEPLTAMVSGFSAIKMMNAGNFGLSIIWSTYGCLNAAWKTKNLFFFV